MKTRRIAAAAAWAACALASNAQAAGLSDWFLGQPDRPVSRRADQDLGYSVLYPGAGGRGSPRQVLVVCTTAGTFGRALCPTSSYVAVCPAARIACR